MGDSAKYKKQWFDYYSFNQVKELVEYITNLCRVNGDENPYVDSNVKHEIEQFIDEASIHIYEILRKVIA